MLDESKHELPPRGHGVGRGGSRRCPHCQRTNRIVDRSWEL